MTNQLEYTTKLWQRSQSSYATTIPREILTIKGVNVDDSVVNWSIDETTGDVIARFTQQEEVQESE